ncbi:MAG: hypothetical protein AAFU67_04150 [Bacteroidota bacterium]
MIAVKIIDGDYLDIAPGAELRTTKTLDRADLSQITQEAALSITGNDTYENRDALREYDPDNINRKTDLVGVEVTSDGDPVPLNVMSVRGYQPLTGYELELAGDEWKDKLKALKMNELVLGTFSWTLQNILDQWAVRDNPLAMPDLVHRGTWWEPNQVIRRDLRLLFNTGKLLKAIFCHIGWGFRSPHLINGDGRWWYDYISPLRWHTYSTKKAEQYVELEVGTTQMTGDELDIIPWTEVEDPDNTWGFIFNQSAETYNYVHNANIDPEYLILFEADFSVTLNPTASPEVPRLVIVLIENTVTFGTQEVRRWNFPGAVDAERTIDISLRHYIERNRPATSTESTFIVWHELLIFYGSGLDGNVPWRINSGSMIFRPDPKYFIEDEDIVLGDILDGEMSALEYLEANAHLMNAKLVTDLARKEVIMYSPYDYLGYDGNNVEGFFQRGQPPLDYRKLTQPNSVQWQDEQIDRERFVLLGFKDDLDKRMEPIGSGAFDRTIDYGRGTPDTDERRNPMFAPTADVNTTTEETGLGGVRIPAMWTVDPPERSHEITPRKLIWAGPLSFGSFIFEGQNQLYTPRFGMILTNSSVQGQGIDPLTFLGFANDLYETHYKQELFDEDDGNRYSVLLAGGDETYDEIDFRRTIIIQGRFGPIELQVTAVRDHPRGSCVPLLVEGRIIKC